MVQHKRTRLQNIISTQVLERKISFTEHTLPLLFEALPFPVGFGSNETSHASSEHTTRAISHRALLAANCPPPDIFLDPDQDAALTAKSPFLQDVLDEDAFVLKAPLEDTTLRAANGNNRANVFDSPARVFCLRPSTQHAETAPAAIPYNDRGYAGCLDWLSPQDSAAYSPIANDDA